MGLEPRSFKAPGTAGTLQNAWKNRASATSQNRLIAYLIFLPAMFLHWKLNRDACILNNLENWLRHRRWRAPEANREEGAWLRTLLADATGISLTRARMDAVIYGAIGVFWLVALARLTHAF